MIAIIVIMIVSVLSIGRVGGRGSKQIAKGQPLMESARVMGQRQLTEAGLGRLAGELAHGYHWRRSADRRSVDRVAVSAGPRESSMDYFTIEIDGPRHFFQAEDFREDLTILQSQGKPVWDGASNLTLRKATADEASEVEHAYEFDDDPERTVDDEFVVFLIPISDMTDGADSDTDET
jgi:hypothetical protein